MVGGPPILTKSGYYTVPSLKCLQMMTSTELAAVSGFEIHHHGFGCVKWLQAVDIRDVDLDLVVDISHSHVRVYQHDDGSEMIDEPPIGEKLNCRAEVTLKLRTHLNTSRAKKEEFAEKVRGMTSEWDFAEFISYNIETGTWVFQVQHFSSK